MDEDAVFRGGPLFKASAAASTRATPDFLTKVGAAANADIKSSAIAGEAIKPWFSFLGFEYTPRRLLASITSAIIMGLLMVAFTSSFAAILFRSKELELFLPVAIEIHLISTAISGIIGAVFGQIPIAVSLVEISPTLIFAEMADIIIKEIKGSTEGNSAATGASNETDTTTASVGDPSPNPLASDILATLLVVIVISTVLDGILFILLGRFKLTRVVQYVPAVVMSSCEDKERLRGGGG